MPLWGGVAMLKEVAAVRIIKENMMQILEEA